MEKIIFVNNPAAINGGALTILKQFIVNVAQKSPKEYKFYIFCTYDLKEFESNNIKIINNIKAKSFKDRIIWDFIGLRKWANKNKIKPNLVISLQNTGILGFRDTNQFVYLHQSLPYYKEIKWNPFNKNERIYWFYRYIYKQIIHITIKKKYLIVQNYWMKKKVVKDHKLDSSTVFVVKPSIEKILGISNNYIGTDTIKLFYPASGEIYKNHVILIEALSKLISLNRNKKFKLYLTLDKASKNSSNLMNIIERYNLKEYIEFLGVLDYSEIIRYYQESTIIVFPSYIETVGLPLIEAAQIGKPIVVSNLEYSREALSKYKGATFVKYNNCDEWVEAILNHIDNIKLYDYNLDLNNESWEKFIQLIKKECEKDI